jgi:hypothetical protein
MRFRGATGFGPTLTEATASFVARYLDAERLKERSLGKQRSQIADRRDYSGRRLFRATLSRSKRRDLSAGVTSDVGQAALSIRLMGSAILSHQD